MNYYKNAALNFGTKLRFSKTFLSVLVVGLLAPFGLLAVAASCGSQ